MTGLLVKIKHRYPSLWRTVERANSILMRLRYPRLPEIAKGAAASRSSGGIKWSIVTPDDADNLSSFLESIHPDRLRYFNPHPFDIHTLRSMASGGSFVMLKVTRDNRIIGYHFLRCFFIGKAFHGLIVDSSCASCGIGTDMWSLGAEICRNAGLSMFATISSSNYPSLASCRKGCDTRVVETLPDGYLVLACSPKTNAE
ncbi:MAG: hypothetical protein K2O30_01525 [Duncaniella sp.]|nr:hypothetical protein [Duncaniella sp.]